MIEEIKFHVSLEDGISANAAKAQVNVHKLSAELTQAKTQLSSYQAQLTRAKSLGDIEGYHKYTEAVAQTKRSVFDLTQTLEAAGGAPKKLGNGFLKVVEPAEVMRHAFQQAGAGLREFSSALVHGDIAGSIKGMTDTMAGLASTLDLVYPGLGQVASAAIKVGGAFLYAGEEIAASLLKTGFEVTEFNNKLEATFQALGHTPTAGKDTLEFLDRLATQLPQSRTDLAKWTETFEGMGITNTGELRQQVTAIASATALMPLNAEKAAHAYTILTGRIQTAKELGQTFTLDKRLDKQLHDLGISLEDLHIKGQKTTKGLVVGAQDFGNALSNALIEKGKGPLEVMGNEIGVVKEKGMEAFMHLFDGVGEDLAPIIDALKDIPIILGSDQGAKKGIHETIKFIASALGEAIVETEVFFLEMETGALKLVPILRPVIDDLEKLGILGRSGAEDFKAFAAGVEGAAGALAHLAVGDVGGAAVSIGKSILESREPIPQRTSPAHAEGGLVGRPAPGEFFASVAPGESIVSKEQTQIGGNAIRGLMSMMSSKTDTSTDSSSKMLHIEHLNLTIDAPAGVTDAHQLSVTGLTLALERIQLASGR